MDLWVRSQDRKELRPQPKLGIDDEIEGLFYIVDRYDFDRAIILGKYKTKERALEVLDEIDEFIDLFNRKGFGNVLSDDGVHSKHTVYRMPKE